MMTNQVLCKTTDLIANSGVCARIELHGQTKQIALFYVPKSELQVFALDNWDPIGEANVLSRGIVGDIGSELVVASPLYKQHFSLISGQCLEEEGISVQSYSVSLEGTDVMLHATPA